MRFRLLRVAALALLAVSAAGVSAQTYPAKPVRVVVPLAAGGTADIFTRQLGQMLTKTWGQPVLVENRPGAAQIIGTDAVAKSAPDGYTLLMTADAALCTNHLLYSKLPYDPARDFAPVTALVRFAQWVVVHSSVPAKSLQELVAHAKAKPGSLNYGSFGPGSPPHLAVELLKHVAGIDAVHVPYKGVAPLLTDLTTGVIQMSILGGSTLPAIRAGQLRPLAIDGTKRSLVLPEVPTFAEAGFPEMQAPTWWGIAAPAGTPRPLIDKLQRDIGAVLANPEFRRESMEKNGYEPAGNTPEEFAQMIRQTTELWTPIIKRANIRLD